MFNPRASRGSSREAGRDDPFTVYGRSGVKAQEVGKRGRGTYAGLLRPGLLRPTLRAPGIERDRDRGPARVPAGSAWRPRPAGPDRPRRRRPGRARRVRGRWEGARGRRFAPAGPGGLPGGPSDCASVLARAAGWGAGARWARGDSCRLGSGLVVRGTCPHQCRDPRGVSGGAWVASGPPLLQVPLEIRSGQCEAADLATTRLPRSPAKR